MPSATLAAMIARSGSMQMAPTAPVKVIRLDLSKRKTKNEKLKTYRRTGSR
jgi:hypothetical protein